MKTIKEEKENERTARHLKRIRVRIRQEAYLLGAEDSESDIERIATNFLLRESLNLSDSIIVLINSFSHREKRKEDYIQMCLNLDNKSIVESSLFKTIKNVILYASIFGKHGNQNGLQI